jgi:hypothetical protein
VDGCVGSVGCEGNCILELNMLLIYQSHIAARMPVPRCRATTEGQMLPGGTIRLQVQFSPRLQ